MNLGELIAALETLDPATKVRDGFGRPHSYRGDYQDLAFEPVNDTTIGAMLAAARSALDATYEGWKGGEYTMDESSCCWLDFEGVASGTPIDWLVQRLLHALVEADRDALAERVRELEAEITELRRQWRAAYDLVDAAYEADAPEVEGPAVDVGALADALTMRYPDGGDDRG